MAQPLLIAAGLLTGCFALAVTVEPNLASHPALLRHERAAVEVVLGDARRLLAGHFFVKADVYFHSGYYPSIFDGAALHEKDNHEDADFLGKPRDLIDRFSRSFYPSTHTHLDEEHHDHSEHEGHEGHDEHSECKGGDVREMLPWLKFAAELDPNRIETYTVGAYWLRTRMNNSKQAEALLREGLRANPGNVDILFELGRIYYEDTRDIERARNLWSSALSRWNATEKTKSEPDNLLLLDIAWHLAVLEEKAGNVSKAIDYLRLAKTVSPNPAAVQDRIDELSKPGVDKPSSF